MTARALLLVVAVTCTAGAVVARRGDDRCADVVRRAATLNRNAPPTAATATKVARDVLDRCSSSSPVAGVAVRLSSAGRGEQAMALARAMTRREPEDFLGWLTLGAVQDEGPGKDRALRRAHDLNPRVVRLPY